MKKLLLVITLLVAVAGVVSFMMRRSDWSAGFDA